MSLIPDEIKQAWREAALDFNIDLGHICTLYFESEPSIISNSTQIDISGGKPHVLVPFGQRSHGFNTPGHPLMTNTTDDTVGQSVKITETTKDIQARIYQFVKNYEHFGLNVRENITVYEVITLKTFTPDLLRAKHVLFYSNQTLEKQIKAKLIKPPTPYGLGNLYQCRSFWEEI